MSRSIGLLLTITFLAMSLAGTLGSAWFLADVLTPTGANRAFNVTTTAASMIGLAALAEGLRVMLAWHGETIWKGSRFQGAAVATPLWLACTAYCLVVPILTVAVVYVATPTALTIVGISWLFIQATASLLPALAWPGAPIRAENSEGPAARADGPVPEPSQPKLASADDFLLALRRLVGSGHQESAEAESELSISQSELAALAGRSRPTVRRWLDDLENSQRIARHTAGKITRIRLLEQPVRVTNGDARH